MADFLLKEYYLNTVSEWLIAIGIIAGGVILAKLVYLVFGRFLRVFTAKTSRKFDDILVNMLEEPVVFGLAILGFYFGTNRLHKTEAVSLFVENVYSVLIAICVTWFIVRIVNAIIEEYLLPVVEKSESDFDDQLLPIVKKVISITIWTIGIIVALNNAGYNVTALITGMGIGGLAFALAAKDFVENIFGGISVFTDKPFLVKERIKIDGFDGHIEEIGLRRTRLRTLSGTLVTIPNSKFIHENIENISAEPTKKISATLGLTYDNTANDIEKAMNILKEVVLEHKTVVTEEPVINFHSFGDFSLNINFTYFLRKDAGYFETIGSINLAVLKRFNEAGLEFAFPTQTIHAVK